MMVIRAARLQRVTDKDSSKPEFVTMLACHDQYKSTYQTLRLAHIAEVARRVRIHPDVVAIHRTILQQQGEGVGYIG